MNEFLFDLQRFATNYDITAGGEAVSVTGDGTTNGISLTVKDSSDTVLGSYYLTLTSGGKANVSATADGIIKLQVTSGTASEFKYQSGTGKPTVIFLSGSFTSYVFTGQNVILGSESGPTIKFNSGLSSTRANISLDTNGQLTLKSD